MNGPLVLWRTRQTTTSDDAGTTIIKSILSPVINPGPYEHKVETIYRFVPSLAYFTLKILAEYPDELDFGPRLYYQPPSSPLAYDILRALISSYDPRPESESDFSLTTVDPRLWAVLVQVYSNLPEAFRTYRIPLSDKHLPVLQRIRSTSEFSLITVLDLGGCEELTDETILTLKFLHGLCAFDANGTALSAYGVRVMSRTLGLSEGKRRGPWGLRILRLTNCKAVDNSIFNCLLAFPLLSVVDLRGTKCIPDTSASSIFWPGSNKDLYHPTPLTTSLCILALSTTNLFPCPDPRPCILHITSLHHTAHAPVRSRPSVVMQDTYVVIPAIKKESNRKERKHTGNDPRAKLMVGNSEVLEMKRARMEEFERHERNKEAWYERHDEAIRRGDGMSLGMDDFHDRFESDTDAMGDSEDEGQGKSETDSLSDEEDEDEDLGGTDDNDDGESFGEEDEHSGDESDKVLNEYDPATFRENWLSNVSSLPPLACSSPRVSETKGEGQIRNVNHSPNLAHNINDKPAPPNQTNAEPNYFASSPSSTLISTQPAPSTKPLHHNLRTGLARTSTPDMRRPRGSPKNSGADILAGPGHSSRHKQAGHHPTGPTPKISNNLSTGTSTSSGACNEDLRTESRQYIRSGHGRASADLDVLQPLISHKRRKIADESPVRASGSRTAPLPRRIHVESAFDLSGLAATSRHPRITDSQVSGRIEADDAPPQFTHQVGTTVRRPPHPSMVPSISSEIDLQNSVAEREARKLASRQAATTFYRGSSTNARPPSRPQTQQKPCDHDELLMLYRNPPPWGDLDAQGKGPSAAIKTERRQDAAILNRTSAKGTAGVKALAEMIKRRKDLRGPHRAGEGVMNRPTTESRNPFRRREIPQSDIESGSRKEASTHPAPPPQRTTRDSGFGRFPNEATMKPPLKPISFLKVPVLPEECRKQTVKKTSVSQKQISNEGTTPRMGLPRPPNSQAQPQWARMKGDAKEKRAFDWGTWSTSARDTNGNLK